MQRIENIPRNGPHEQSEHRPVPDLSPKTILIVEDDRAIGELLLEVLSQETPYQALLVTDGLQALQMVKQVRPSLFITDYRLPSMNGIELYDHLHAQKILNGTPVIIISAYLPPEEEVKKRQMIGMRKPFELDDLLDKVETLLDNDSGASHPHHHAS